VPSENVNASPSTGLAPGAALDRRTRKRAERTDRLLDLAADLVERHGVEQLTMAALADAADYAPASLYTYFPSRSALLAALQKRALAVLADVTSDHLATWVDHTAGLAPQPATLVRLWCFSDLFLAAPDLFPREFRLQQQLLVAPGAEDTQDAATVVPAAMALLDVPRRLLDDAVARGALEPAEDLTDPVDAPLDGSFMRALAWVVALNGALMVDGLSTGVPSTGARLGTSITASLLRGWGASPDELTTTRSLADATTSSTTTAHRSEPR
jgi:AcrR family transcriptional regulator